MCVPLASFLHGVFELSSFRITVGDDWEGALFVDSMEKKLLKKYISISKLGGLQKDFTVEDPFPAALE
ncbi:uncharacterized protein ANIA_11283 [Aspergillus nidulans FGSC A4]|jgi:hypothetical protein|uniref:Uncharacterized protein n=1 Tax=Emericella nidulans (strain FGSC A4 / ATCC 38163 / CBS 112.46 / NRRL 194 / M139) TaxID=227321 RepID=C8VQD5_EMENI|nr:hypothetical protein [Aspergillus nidulans FGSC A4]CBF88683.1 TPA: hypothetical protein ANIA_11283 [Aspergillus nidulans FGSC A4]